MWFKPCILFSLEGLWGIIMKQIKKFIYLGKDNYGENVIFAIQRLDELLFLYTKDSYKAPVYNVKELLQEYIDVYQKSKAGIIDEKNLEPIGQELLWSLQRDEEAYALIGNKTCKAFIDKYSQLNIDERFNVIKLLFYKIDKKEYLESIKKSLITALKGKEKSKIDEKLVALIVALKNIGYESRYIYKLLYMDLVRPKSIVFEDFESFLEEFDCKQKKYELIVVQEREVLECCIKLSQILEDVKIKRIKNKNLPEELCPLNDNEMALSIKYIQTYDEYAAVEETKGLIKTFEQFYLFYRNEPQTKTQIYIKLDDSYQVLRSDERGIRKSVKKDSRSDSLEKAKSMLDISTRTMSAFYHLNRVLDIHNTALDVESPQSALLSLWSILELLLEESKKGNNSRINQIEKMLIPFLKYNYIKGFVLTFKEDLERWHDKRYIYIINNIEEGDSSLEKLYIFLVMDKYESLRKEIKSELDSFPLLRYRMYSLEKMLGSWDNLNKCIELHERKVKWHIKRIYRMRNVIIHNGGDSKYVDSLVENLHHYIDELCEGICHVFEEQKRFALVNDAIEEMIFRNQVMELNKCKGKVNGIDDIKRILNYRYD